MRILSWNVNGIRAVQKKGFLNWLMKEQPEILCLQEIKASKEQFPKELLNVPGYTLYINPAARPGYSGVAMYTKPKPLSVSNSFGAPRFDDEGRIQVADYGRFKLYNIYFPNGKMSAERLQYKLDFYEAFLEHLKQHKNEPILICGDVNTAHKEIDLARPKENEKESGFLPVERAWIDRLIATGFIDTFRAFNQQPGQYTWWALRTAARKRNVGWRLDYFFASPSIMPKIKNSFIMSEVEGSDHCPVGVELSL